MYYILYLASMLPCIHIELLPALCYYESLFSWNLNCHHLRWISLLHFSRNLFFGPIHRRQLYSQAILSQSILKAGIYLLPLSTRFNSLLLF